MQTKVCSNCKIEKPLTDFHKRKAGKYGRNSQCRKCILLKGKNYRRNKPLIQSDISEKKCSMCGIIKSVTEYYKSKFGDGYRAYCKECKLKKGAEYRKIAESIPKICVEKKQCRCCKQWKDAKEFHKHGLTKDG